MMAMALMMTIMALMSNMLLMVHWDATKLSQLLLIKQNLLTQPIQLLYLTFSFQKILKTKTVFFAGGLRLDIMWKTLPTC